MARQLLLLCCCLLLPKVLHSSVHGRVDTDEPSLGIGQGILLQGIDAHTSAGPGRRMDASPRQLALRRVASAVTFSVRGIITLDGNVASQGQRNDFSGTSISLQASKLVVEVS